LFDPMLRENASFNGVRDVVRSRRTCGEHEQRRGRRRLPALNACDGSVVANAAPTDAGFRAKCSTHSRASQCSLS